MLSSSWRGTGPALADLMESSPPFVDRRRQLESCDKWLQRALAGEPVVVLLQGEAGVGKTRLLNEIRERVLRHGFLVCAGRAYEDMTLPYLPFVNSLFAQLQTTPGAWRDECVAELALLARLVQGEPQSSLAVSPLPTADTEYQALQRLLAIARATVKLAQFHPLLLILDDVQWADQPSLEVFSHLVFSLAETRLQEPIPLMLVGAYRPGEPTSRWMRAVDRFRREEHCHTLLLPALEEDEVHELIRHLGVRRPSRQLVKTVTTAAHGNPLYIQEVMRQLTARGAFGERAGYITATVAPADLFLPEQLQTLIVARTQPLTEQQRNVLTFAALLGGPWSLSILQEVSGVEEESLLDIVAQAVRQRILLMEGQTFTFAHPFIRQGLLADLLPLRRQRLHWRIAQTLAALSAPEEERAIGAIAFHLVHAGSEAEAATIVRYTRRAAEQAMTMASWGEAAWCYEAALSVADTTQCLSPRERAELHFRAGLAYYRDMDVGPCLSHYEQAIAAYQLCDDHEGAARVLMARTRAYLTQASVPYGALVNLEPLEEILRALGEQQPLLRGQMLATMAEAYWTARQTARARDLAEQAVTIGRSLADAGLCALASHVLALTYTQRAQPQEALAQWSAALDFAREAQDPWLQLWPLARIPWMLLSLGRIPEAEVAAEEACAFARKLQNWAEYSQALATQIGIAVLKGDFVKAEDLGREIMLMVQRSHYPWGSARALPALAGARVLRGAWDDAHEAITTLIEPRRLFAEAGPAFQAVARVYHRLIRARSGALEEVRTEVAADPEWGLRRTRAEQGAVARLCALVELSDLLNVPEAAAALYPLLSQVAAQGLFFTTEWMFLLPRILGVAAALNHWWESADTHFQEALTVAKRSGARPEYARTCLDYARMLVGRDHDHDRERALTLVEEACPLFTDFAMTPFLNEARQLLERLRAPASTALPLEERPSSVHTDSLPQALADASSALVAENIFRQEGDHWLLSYQGKSCLLKNMKGLHVIAYLLRYPNEQFDATLLSTLGDKVRTESAAAILDVAEERTLIKDGLRVGKQSATERSDAQARVAYRRRLAELREDLAEAERFHDLGRATKDRAEIEFLLTELRVTTGLGGRARRMNAVDERARLGVRKAITTAIRHIKTRHASLASHLAASLRTGTRCCYVSDPTRPVEWII